MAQIDHSRASELCAELAETGSLRVIVGFALDAAETGALASAQKQLIGALAETEHTVVLAFPASPLLALIVGPDALEVLLSHRFVKSIMVDRPRRATPAP